MSEQPAPQPVRQFLKIANEVALMTHEKNLAYGDSFCQSGDILRILYPKGIAPYAYDNMLAIVRVIDKLFRLASGHDGAFGESAWRDIIGYGLLGAERTERLMRAAREKDATKVTQILMEVAQSEATSLVESKDAESCPIQPAPRCSE
jgi:hypothetical protein